MPQRRGVERRSRGSFSRERGRRLFWGGYFSLQIVPPPLSKTRTSRQRRIENFTHPIGYDTIVPGIVITYSIHLPTYIMTNQQRKNATTNAAINTVVEPIDEQAQEAIIKELQTNLMKQTSQMAKFLSYICYSAGIISFMTIFLHDFESKYKFYPAYAAIVHCFAGYMAQDLRTNLLVLLSSSSSSATENGRRLGLVAPSNSIITGKVGIAIGTAASNLPLLWHMGMHLTRDLWVIILGGTNIYTFMAVAYMKKDFMKTLASLEELKDAKYKHKSV